jgi:hypothetical protein
MGAKKVSAAGGRCSVNVTSRVRPTSHAGCASPSMSRVILMDECPICSCTTLGCSPLAKSSVAYVWRVSWSFLRSMPAVASAWWNFLFRKLGSRGARGGPGQDDSSLVLARRCPVALRRALHRDARHDGVRGACSSPRAPCTAGS